MGKQYGLRRHDAAVHDSKRFAYDKALDSASGVWSARSKLRLFDFETGRIAERREGSSQTMKRVIVIIAASLWMLCPAPRANSAVADASGRNQSIEAKAGELLLTVRPAADGIRVSGLRDLKWNEPLLASNPLPLFSVTLRRLDATQEIRLTSETGWTRTSVREKRRALELRWNQPTNETAAGISVLATATLDQRDSAIRWDLHIENPTTNWTVWRVVFPQLAVADFGTNGAVLFPRGPGEVQRGVWQRAFRYRGDYPGGWCAMQFMAAYRDGARPTGLYLGLHDPFGGTKNLDLRSDPTNHTARLGFDVPAPDMGRAGNSFTLQGEAVWQLLRGDWFDAATVYKRWAQREARWWPKLGREGRGDTVPWMRELSAWALGGGAPGECVTNVQRFQQFLGVPAGFHWYNWHQIPFDNDYPHYFPTKTGFASGVRELQAANVFVMPYINGRLWDSKDRGAQDFEFTRVALPAVTKQPDGKPFLESYGSKETNGEPVRLAAMCPSTPLWQTKVSNIVLRLLREEGTRAVYIDQIAAAAPTLCTDAAHGHPLGGGHWWNEGYWRMLDAIRRAMPRDAMLTTECNGEPFVRWFDGYLTWHWQHDGQVPAFPAIYGGAIQMFGRAYRGGPTKDIALRMKAGQQLVFGEQIGWLGPEVVKDKEADFFRRVVQLRHEFRRYFHAGEMARPPRLIGEMPKVKADWQWSGEWPVTTDAVLAGAWRLPKEKRLVLLFANVSDQVIAAKLRFDANEYGLRAKQLRARVVGENHADAHVFTAGFEQLIQFSPRSVQGWELTY